ncbi:MFS transporter [Peribacillus sp. SCS-155]|uniref:MFS transporter n=1 Tax=Peribacillus sedimenti TaxID=3115297 RepID=UPI0039065B67
MKIRSFIYYQSIMTVASSMIFPFYILMLKNAGNSYAQFGWAYGLYALTSSIAFPVIGKLSDKIGDRTLLILHSWGMSIILLFFPIVTEVWQFYILQMLMGILGAVQKNTEKTSLTRHILKENAGKEIGDYHFWTACAGGAAVILTGYLVDFLTIGSIFYLASIIYFAGGFIWFKKESRQNLTSHTTGQ